MSDVVLVITTVAQAEDAERLATALVHKRLAACVNVVPGVMSVYRWKGAVEHETERLLVIKTTVDRLADLREGILANHPYELPEILVLPVPDGHEPYLRWVRESVDDTPRTGES